MTKPHEVKLECSFCGKAQREVRKLIAGPTVYICDECIKLCNDILAKEKDRRLEAENQPRQEKKERAREPQKLCCSFCGKNQWEVKSLIAGPTVYICDECIGLCNDIIREEIDREEWPTILRARLSEHVRALLAGILERGMPAAVRARAVLRERIFEDLDRRRAAGQAPDERLWAPTGLVDDWGELHDILARATGSSGKSDQRGPGEEGFPGWVRPIADRLTGSLEVLGVLARCLEGPGLEEVRQLHPSVAIACEKLREAREMLLAGPPQGPEESA